CGIAYDQLADIYHNAEDHARPREDQGKYLVFVDIVRFLARIGAGRITAWILAILYVNLRQFGMADFGDWSDLRDYFKRSEKVEKFFSEALNSYREDGVGNYLFIELLGEIILVLQLVAGFRGRKLSQGKNLAEQKIIWGKIANVMLDNVAQLISLLSGWSESEVRNYLVSIINVERYATQMRFWMTDEYIPYLANNKIPEAVYGPDVKVVLDRDQFREGTFDENKGCSIDGENPDLGAVNGQFPIKEAEKMIYVMAILGVIGLQEKHNIQQAVLSVKQLLKEDKAISKEDRARLAAVNEKVDPLFSSRAVKILNHLNAHVARHREREARTNTPVDAEEKDKTTVEVMQSFFKLWRGQVAKKPQPVGDVRRSSWPSIALTSDC
ncbi:MAG: hypothetical protein K0U12_01390, partial [Gammaproteobacteria bacterium]|nr:hypothetical protein [Gammaproteobacteria bacterium]